MVFWIHCSAILCLSFSQFKLKNIVLSSRFSQQKRKHNEITSRKYATLVGINKCIELSSKNKEFCLAE